MARFHRFQKFHISKRFVLAETVAELAKHIELNEADQKKLGHNELGQHEPKQNGETRVDGSGQRLSSAYCSLVTQNYNLALPTKDDIIFAIELKKRYSELKRPLRSTAVGLTFQCALAAAVAVNQEYKIMSFDICFGRIAKDYKAMIIP